MSVKFLIDMNLSPDWIRVLGNHGWQTVHIRAALDRGRAIRSRLDA